MDPIAPPTSASRRSPGARMRELFNRPGIMIAPGVYDGFSLRLVEQMGYKTAAISGAALSESTLGWADVGIMGYAENLRASGALAAISSIPLSADGDTGYGNALNVYFTVQGFERAGLACLLIEDQVWPKRCGHMEGKQVIGADEMAQKVRAAVDARTDPDFVIIARTDARAVEGLDSALDRARRYRDAGADVLFIEALVSEAEIEAAAAAFPDVPLLFNWAEGGKTPPVSLGRLTELGYRIVIFPIGTLLAATAAMRRILREIAAAGTPASLLGELPTFGEFTDFIGLPEVRGIEQRYIARES